MHTTVKGEALSSVPSNLVAEARLQWLTERMRDSGAVSIADAAYELGVSEMTIRRDLAELEERGTARRVRGGAMPLGPQPFAERHRVRSRAKGQIAAKLTPLLPAEGAVAFDASSTIMRLAANLGAARDLTVLTNGPDTFNALQDQPGVVPILTGGQLEVRTGSLVGALACRSAAQLATDRFFASAAAVDSGSGALETTLEEAEVKRALAAAASEVVLAIDASKLGQRAVAVGLEWDRIDVLVTELDPRDERLAPFRALARVI
jgi:DeoR family fructose operon transcriptional repressor